VKQARFAYVNHARSRSWNQQELSSEGKVSCSMKQREPLVRYLLRHATPLRHFLGSHH